MLPPVLLLAGFTIHFITRVDSHARMLRPRISHEPERRGNG
jgi:hypothetical protein